MTCAAVDTARADSANDGATKADSAHDVPAKAVVTDVGADVASPLAAGLLPFEAIPEFKACSRFVGRFPGMAFMKGPQGLGYYRDVRGAPVTLRDVELRMGPAPLADCAAEAKAIASLRTHAGC